MSSTRVPDPDGVWIKAGRSTSGGQCVEMRRRGSGVEVRDSKNPDGPVLRFPPGEFSAWLRGASRGDFCRLTS